MSLKVQSTVASLFLWCNTVTFCVTPMPRPWTCLPSVIFLYLKVHCHTQSPMQIHTVPVSCNPLEPPYTCADILSGPMFDSFFFVWFSGGTLKIYGESIKPETPYKTLLLSTADNVRYVIRETMDKYGMDFTVSDPEDYCLVQVRYTWSIIDDHI